MTDNTRGGSESGSAPLIATDEVTHSGDVADVQLTRPVHVSGAEGSKTVTDVTDTNGLKISSINDPVDVNGPVGVAGTVPHDSSDGGVNPIKIGGRADTGIPTPVADDDRVDAWFNSRGALAVNIVAGDDGSAITSALSGLAVTPTGPQEILGNVAHDVADAGNPVKIGGKANAAAPSDVSANNERVDAWFLRNGAQASALTAAGALIGGDASNGLDVDVTRLPALVAGTANIGDVDVLTVPAPLNVVGGGTEAAAQRVTIANDSTGVVSVDDNGASLTVDGSVTAVGGAAHASPVSGNPNLIAGRASAVIPTDVGADGDAASMWTNRNGAQMVSTAPHIGLNSDPWNLVHETAQYTTTQTSTVLVAGGASEKIVVTKVQIQAGGTTAGAVQLYFGTGAYSRGTSRAIFDGEFAPSATLKPGVVMDGPFIAGTNGDDLMVTDSAAINPLTITVWYYVIT